jgi:hypothetical protein
MHLARAGESIAHREVGEVDAGPIRSTTAAMHCASEEIECLIVHRYRMYFDAPGLDGVSG